MALVKAGVVVLDCAEPEKLAVFYKELLDAEE
ncbi:MAG: VOC family protein, partial [Streptomyces sp.]|nr:VOC family protein [Streptomyces sp.]